MYECSRCGNRRNCLSPCTADKFQNSGKDYIEGASSWCNLCNELTFFMKHNAASESVQILFRQSLDSIDSVTCRISTLNSGKGIQNQQAASLANHMNNWAVEAVDPPRNGGSFNLLPNRHGNLNRNQHIEDDPVTPPVTPLNVSPATSTRSDASTLRNSSPAKVVPSRSKRSGKIKGIELMRSTPPRHMNPVLPLELDRRLSPVNPYARTYKHRDDQNQRSETSTKRVKSSDLYSLTTGPGLTIKDIKKLQRRFAADESSAKPGTSKQAKSPDSRPKNSSNMELQKKLLEKRRQMRKLALMRNRLDAECETARTELDVLEKRTHRSSSGRSKRQSGGAHMTLQRLKSKAEMEKKITEGKKLHKEESLETLLKALHEEDKPYIKSKDLDSDRISQESLETLDPSLESETDTETVTESDSGSDTETNLETPLSTTQRESIVVRKQRIYVPLPYQLRNPFATPANVGFYMPSGYRPRDNFERTQPLGEPRRMCILLSSAQRALFSSFVNDPLDIVKLIRSLDESMEVCLNAPRAQFSTIACSEKELIRLIEKKPQMTKLQKTKELDVSRSPVRCPDSDCQRLCFVSDLNNHLLLDHRSLTMERIKARETKTFFLDTNMTMVDKPKCHMVYMVRDKIIDTQAEDLRDLLPVLVMSGRTYLTNALGVNTRGSRTRSQSDIEFFVLWLTGFVPRGMQPMATLSLWSTLGPQMAGCVGVNTGYIYDIRAPNEVGHVGRSRCAMVLPMAMITEMTNNARRFLAVQVQVY
ncbi:uncharacterized protein [Drosophila takahashii]|uniref:uncharacterized protein n=1 Tax=Drosophila takahashii TaxID=29030 RepID=UPI003898DD09